MSLRIGINGFGRIGRLLVRAMWHNPELQLVQLNEPGAEIACFAHLLMFDSTHGRWCHDANATGSALCIDGKSIPFTHCVGIDPITWADCDIVIEASGTRLQRGALQDYLSVSAKRRCLPKVLVTALVHEQTGDLINIVMGVNEQQYDPLHHSIVTAASCTSNCLSPPFENSA